MRKLKQFDVRLTVLRVEPEEARALFSDVVYEDVKTWLTHSAADDNATPRDEPWDVVSFSASDDPFAKPHPRDTFLVLTDTYDDGRIVVRRKNGELSDLAWGDWPRVSDGCFLELVSPATRVSEVDERYLVLLPWLPDEAKALRRAIRQQVVGDCVAPCTFGGRIDPKDDLLLPNLRRIFPSYRTLSLRNEGQ